MLIYDGECGFCTSAAAYIMARSQPKVLIAAWQLIDGSLGKYGLTVEQVSARVYLAVPDGDGWQCFGGYRAFAELLKRQDSRWRRLAGHVLHAPVVRWFSALGYALVARFRHRLPGGTPSCAIRAE